MTAISAAINLNHVSAIVGYEIEASLEGLVAGNLPQKIVILAEANTANQTGIVSQLPFSIAKTVGVEAGYGSPAYHVARILRPLLGDKLGSIPTVLYPVTEAAGATATVVTMSITGTATANATHKFLVSGREGVDGTFYSIAVATGDGAAEISAKVIDAMNNVSGCPGIATVSTTKVVLTSKWKGASSATMNITWDTGGKDAGLTYAIDSTVAGAGVPTLTSALSQIDSEWDTIVINAVGHDTASLAALEAKNGNPNDKTGRYLPEVFKPFVALTGSNKSTVADCATLSATRKDENTIQFCPCPGSLAFEFEAAANFAFLYAPIAENTPSKDPIGLTYGDMPVGAIGDFSNPTNRDTIVKGGYSTIKLKSGKYEIVDAVTTYHPDDEPQTSVLFRWTRDLICDWNIRYKYMIEEQIYVIGKTIVPTGSTSTAPNTISPARWLGRVYTLADQFEDQALIADAQYMKDSAVVGIGESNPNRFETKFDIQRTGVARVIPTTNKTSFEFGG